MPRSLFLRLAIRVDDDTGLAQLLHAADHVTRAGGAPIPERDAYAGGSLVPRWGSQLRATPVVVHPARRAACLKPKINSLFPRNFSEGCVLQRGTCGGWPVLPRQRSCGWRDYTLCSASPGRDAAGCCGICVFLPPSRASSILADKAMSRVRVRTERSEACP